MLSINFSVDGVPIFDSSNNSAYPLLCTINKISPTQRRKHAMLCCLWFGSGKPKSMNNYLKPFVREAKKLYHEGFNYQFEGQTYNKRVVVLMGVCDSVARPMVRCSTQFNGQYGCGLCLHPGEQVDKGRGTVRVYPIIDNNPFREGLRNHQDTMIHAKNKTKGMKEIPILREIPLLDVVYQLDADWMHCVLLQVCQQFANLIFDPKNNSESFYFGAMIDEVDALLLSFSPTMEVSRTTRKISDRSHWKAHEWAMY